MCYREHDRIVYEHLTIEGGQKLRIVKWLSNQRFKVHGKAKGKIE